MTIHMIHHQAFRDYWAVWRFIECGYRGLLHDQEWLCIYFIAVSLFCWLSPVLSDNCNLIVCPNIGLTPPVETKELKNRTRRPILAKSPSLGPCLYGDGRLEVVMERMRELSVSLSPCINKFQVHYTINLTVEKCHLSSL